MRNQSINQSDTGERLEQSATTPIEGIASHYTTKPTIEEFAEHLQSSDVLDQSRHGPNKPANESSKLST
jgi:hypothetical protein